MDELSQYRLDRNTCRSIRQLSRLPCSLSTSSTSITLEMMLSQKSLRVGSMTKKVESTRLSNSVKRCVSIYSETVLNTKLVDLWGSWACANWPSGHDFPFVGQVLYDNPYKPRIVQPPCR